MSQTQIYDVFKKPVIWLLVLSDNNDPKYRVLNISLASFNENKADYENFKDQIQLNILQQILYSQKADKLPESRINRIFEFDYSNKKNWLYIGSFLILILSFYLLLNFYQFQLDPQNWYISESFDQVWKDTTVSFILLIFLFFSSIIFLSQLIITSVANLRLKKIGLNLEAELEEKNKNKDVLNMHIDEILYFFEKIDTEIVIIEDLDRFNTTEIFRTLREVNFILNTYLANIAKENSRKVTFLYAIKDDLFLNELDRTKFFDLIIPAIPFVNYSNSKNVLKSKLDSIFQNENGKEKPSKEFINTVSSFITDNRTLTNIVNEFIVYREQQKVALEELNPEKLLAIIIYKNLRPKDFSRIHTNSSNVDLIFLNKPKLIYDSMQEVITEIGEIEDEIAALKNMNIRFQS